MEFLKWALELAVGRICTRKNLPDPLDAKHAGSETRVVAHSLEARKRLAPSSSLVLAEKRVGWFLG